MSDKNEIVVAMPRLLALAQREAKYVGMNSDDQLDCAISFVEKWLFKGDIGVHQERLAARNHARDFQRCLLRRQFHKVSWPDNNSQSDRDVPNLFSKVSSDPCKIVLQREFWQRVGAVLDRIDAIPRLLFLRHYINGDSVQELAVRTNRTPEAVRKSLLRTRKRLRTSLQRCGCVPDEFVIFA